MPSALTRRLSQEERQMTSARPTTARRPHEQSDLALAQRQLRAIEAFNRARAARERAEADAARTRELRLDAARHLEVLQRQHQALVGRTDRQLRESGQVLMLAAPARAVLAHRSAWFGDKVAALLADRQVRVVERVDNGADAVGIVVAEQPDLLLVEDGLLMVPGEQVVREARHYSEGTVIVAQASSADRLEALRDAGADVVVTRRATPAEVVGRLTADARLPVS
jgi:hypothetical protein